MEVGVELEKGFLPNLPQLLSCTAMPGAEGAGSIFLQLGMLLPPGQHLWLKERNSASNQEPGMKERNYAVLKMICLPFSLSEDSVHL